MICNNCHSEVPDGSAFCNNCGAGLAPQQPREAPAYKASNYTEAYDQQQEAPAYKASNHAEAYGQQQQQEAPAYKASNYAEAYDQQQQEAPAYKASNHAEAYSCRSSTTSRSSSPSPGRSWRSWGSSPPARNGAGRRSRWSGSCLALRPSASSC